MKLQLGKKLMPLIHLPVQSGSNKILEAMNRKHSVEEYIDILKKLIKVKPEIEAFDTGHLWFAKQLVNEGLIENPVMGQLCMNAPGGAQMI